MECSNKKMKTRFYIISFYIIICWSCIWTPRNPELGNTVSQRLHKNIPMNQLTKDTIVSLFSIIGIECDEIFMFSPAATRSQIAYAIASDDFEFRNSNETQPFVILRYRGKTIKSGDWTDDIKLYLPFSESIKVPPYCNFKGEPYVFPYATSVGSYGHLKATHVVLGKRKDNDSYYPTDVYCIYPVDVSSRDSFLNNQLYKYSIRDGEMHSMGNSIWNNQISKDELNIFISNNVCFPQEDILDVKSIPNRVAVFITIERDGQISKAELLMPRGDYWDEEALRVTSLFPPYMFAQRDEEVIRVKTIISFDFRKIYEDHKKLKEKL